MRHLVLLVWLFPATLMAQPLRVFVSVLPIQTFVEKVGGEHVEVRAMVRAGYNPHTYEPTPQQIAALARTKLYIGIGVPFETAWMTRIRAASPAMQVLDLRSAVASGGLVTHHQEGGEVAGAKALHGQTDTNHDHPRSALAHNHTEHQDPHIWTSPPLVKRMVGVIRDKLVELDPVHRKDYARNYIAFVRELDELDREIHALLDPLHNRRFMVFHPAWGYFADAYGLIQVPIEHDGKEPGARALVTLIEQARKQGIRGIFVQPQFDKRQASQVAQAIGGSVIAVDPLAADYVDNLRQVARQFAKALQP